MGVDRILGADRVMGALVRHPDLLYRLAQRLQSVVFVGSWESGGTLRWVRRDLLTQEVIALVDARDPLIRYEIKVDGEPFVLGTEPAGANAELVREGVVELINVWFEGAPRFVEISTSEGSC